MMSDIAKTHDRGKKRPATPRRTAEPEPQPEPEEIGGPSGPEPTRYGDWERKGRCTDF